MLDEQVQILLFRGNDCISRKETLLIGLQAYDFIQISRLRQHLL